MANLLSAVQPSHCLTLGNYLGAIKGWVEMQHQHNCLFFAVDMHAITVRQDREELHRATYEALAIYLAAGIDPKRAGVFVQSHISEHAELSWILTCYASMGELSRMTQFKDKSAKFTEGQSVGAGLFAYPVLMAADILLYETNLVPVGADQSQHLQLARDLAIRMNHVTGQDLFVVPEAIMPKVGARIMSLQDPSRKMSKSDPDKAASVFLLDTDDAIVRKIKRAVTDSGEEVTYDDDKCGVQNLLNINAAVTSRSIEAVVTAFQGKRYGHLKAETAEAVVEAVRPIREKAQTFLEDTAQLDAVLYEGAERARTRARKTLARVYDAIGFIPQRAV